jgi:hypothetical protein
LSKKIEYLFAGSIPILFSISNALFIKLITAGEDETVSSNYFYAAAIIMSILALQEFGITNQLSTYIFSKTDEKSNSVIVTYSLVQVILTMMSTYLFFIFDEKVSLSFYGLTLISISLLVSKKMWGLVYTTGLKWKRTKVLFFIAFSSILPPLFLLLQNASITYEYVLLFILAFYLTAILIVFPLKDLKLAGGLTELIDLFKSMKQSAFMFSLTNVFALLLVFLDRRLIFTLGGDAGQVLMSVSLIAMNIGTMVTSGTLKLVWRDQIKLSHLIIKIVKRNVYLVTFLLLISISTLELLVIYFFDLVNGIQNYVFMFFMLMSMPFMVITQVISVEQYSEGKFNTISRVSIVSILVHCVLISIMNALSTSLSIEHIAIKWFSIYFLTSIYLINKNGTF